MTAPEPASATGSAEPYLTFRRNIPVAVPINQGQERQDFDVTFRMLPSEQIADFDVSTPAGGTAFLRRVIIRVDGLADGHGRPLEYTEALRDRVIALPYVRAAMAPVYFAAATELYCGEDSVTSWL